MNPVDIILLVLLVIGAFRGYQKGFLLEIVGILALLLGIFGALKLLQLGMDFISKHVEISSSLLPYATFIILFILILLGVNLIGRLVKRLLNLTLLGTIDNLAGALLGIFKWAIGISFILWVTSYFGLNFLKEEEQSQLYDYITGLAPWFMDVVQDLLPSFKEFPDPTKWA